MKKFALLLVTFAFGILPNVQAHTIFLRSTENTRPDSALIFITSFYKGDTIRETLKWGDTDLGYMHNKVRHHRQLKFTITCPGFNPITFFADTEQADFRFVLGKKGTKYLIGHHRVVPYIPHPKEIYVLYDPRKSKALQKLFDRLKVPYNKKWFTQVRPQIPGRNYDTEALWKITHSTEIKPNNSQLLNALRKADSVVYDAGSILERFDLNTCQFQMVMLTQTILINEDNYTHELEAMYKTWEQKGYVQEDPIGGKIKQWKAPAHMGVGLIEMLNDFNQQFFLSGELTCTDFWN